MRLLRECAARYGRTLAEEMRVAVELHVTTSILQELSRPDARTKLGDDAERLEQEVRDQLLALAERAYRRPPAGLLANLVWVSERVNQRKPSL
jgi:hypothetical protein